MNIVNIETSDPSQYSGTNNPLACAKIAATMRKKWARELPARRRLERLEVYLRIKGVVVPTDEELDAVFGPVK